MKFTHSALTPLAALLLTAGLCLSVHAQVAPVAPVPPVPPEAELNEADYLVDLMEFEVEGNTVLPASAIETAVTPFLGPRRKQADVEGARLALEKLYQQAGYLTVFVDVAQVDARSGVVTFQVLEGRVERLLVTGSRYFSQGYIRSKVSEVAEGEVPNFNALQNQLAVVNRSDERRVQPVLRPGKAPGTVEVEMKVEDKLPLSGTAEINNLHADNTEPLRLNVGLRYNNLFQRDHGLALTVMVAPQAVKQSRVLLANYSIPRDNGDTLALTAVYSDSEVDTLGSTQVLGNGSTFGLRYIMPLTVRSEGFHSVSAGVDYKNLRTGVLQGTSLERDLPLHYLPFQLGYNGNWAGAGSSTQLSSNVVAGVSRLLRRSVFCLQTNSIEEEFVCNGAEPDANGKVIAGRERGFATLRADLRHSEFLRWGPLGSVNLRLSGQYSGTALVSAEQFVVGGGDTVRGYLESAAAGDTGWLTSLELRSRNFARPVGAVNTTPLATGDPHFFRDITVLGFLDAGQVRLIQPQAGQKVQEDLLGAGMGLRATGRDGWTFAFDLAQPINRTSTAPKRDPRAHLRLGVKF